MGNDWAGLLNEKCSCSTLDTDYLREEFSAFSSEETIPLGIKSLYSETPSFIQTSDRKRFQEILDSVRNALDLPEVRKRIFKGENFETKPNRISGGVFLSLDFHHTKEGPKLIEINTNAGGAYMQLKLIEAQIRCCKAVDIALPSKAALREIEEKFYSIFLLEWHANGRTGLPGFIAVVDEDPSGQFLYPEFLLFRNLFRSKGIESEILDPKQIEYAGDGLYFEGKRIDMIYNRLTDFHLSRISNIKIRQAWGMSHVVVTPNPDDYDLFADKSNLVVLSDGKFLDDAGLSGKDSAVLRSAVPFTRIVTSENAPEFWEQRRNFFFKPKEGFGGKAAYYGGKLTKSKFAEIVSGEYIGQEFIPPPLRITSVSGEEKNLKMDIRAYVYKREILLLASRLYRGQTTNFRTPGGGFSPVFEIPTLD
ncbi:hypothetical protein [Leptospira wolffii]|uniref:hypothetical protein n=1 Tax=Leptospira wolffii TaxID=409998 RepID=UPI00031DDB96|nr:hypothetical protein [Leptospira wolffii]EPG66238.1 hypothetical protein LEP1GSC061_4162 [Leptospira wolffii serovar Khorat str. Khorat-H2]